MFDDNWMIVYTACGNFVGRVVKEEGKTVTMEPAFSWLNEAVNMGNSIGVMRQAIPLQATLGASKLEIEYVGKQCIKDWPEEDKKKILSDIDTVIDSMKKVSSAQKSGILVPDNKLVVPR